MQPGSGGVPTRQRGFPKCPAVLGWVAAGQNGFLQFAEEPKEASESEYWLLLLRELYPEVTEIGPALAEAGELLRIFDKIRLTLRNKPKV